MTTSSRDAINQTPHREANKSLDGDARELVVEAAKDTNHNAENWVELCARAAMEQDPKKLLELVSEINRLLEVRKNRLSKEVDGKH
jgi:hypothetical protein